MIQACHGHKYGRSNIDREYTEICGEMRVIATNKYIKLYENSLYDK